MAVQRELVGETAHRCGNPHCRIRTLGPSDTAASGTANIGVAAHITAAETGGARFDDAMSPETRKSASNGLWLCQNHAHLVDHNEKRYTVRLLHAWKCRARELAMAELAGQRFVDRSAGLIPHYRRYSDFASAPEGWRLICSEMVEDSTPRDFWQPQKRELIHLVLFELGLNAFQHGGAQWVSVRSRGARFELRHTGDSFNPSNLFSVEGQGGAETMRQLKTFYPDSVVLRYVHNGTVATTSIADVTYRGQDGNPCGVSDLAVLNGGPHALASRTSGCTEIHVYVHRHWAYSDAMALQRALLRLEETRPIVFHGLSTHEHMSDFLRRRMPTARRADDPAT